MKPIRTLAFGLIIGCGAGFAVPAIAQSPCAPEYIMQPGDTLFQVTQQCRVPLAALLEANPQISDINNIAVGARLTIPEASGGDAGDGGASEESYMIEPGDTPFSIAQLFGVSVNALLAANPGLEPTNLQIGTTIRIPVDGMEPRDGVDPPDTALPPGDEAVTISVQPRAGAPGTPITVSGTGYAPGTTVDIGVGPPESEWESLDRAQVRSDGTVKVVVNIPERARPGQPVVFVIDTPAGRTQVSQPVTVVEEGDPDQNPGAFSVEGRVSQGVECLIITTSDGTEFSLAAADQSLTPGEYVRVEGPIAQISTCMQGEGTIDVQSVTEIAPPDE